MVRGMQGEMFCILLSVNRILMPKNLCLPKQVLNRMISIAAVSSGKEPQIL